MPCPDASPPPLAPCHPAGAADDEAELNGSSHTANFVMRFPGCKKQCSVSFESVKAGLTQVSISERECVSACIQKRVYSKACVSACIQKRTRLTSYQPDHPSGIRNSRLEVKLGT